MNQLNKNIIFLLTAQFSKLVIPLITFPYLTRVLGVESFGLLGVALAISTYVWLIAQFGLNLTAVERTNGNLDSNQNLGGLVASVLIIQFTVFSVASFLVLLICYLNEVDTTTTKIIFSYLLLTIGNILMVEWLHQAKEKMAIIVIFSIAGRSLSIPFIYIFVNSPGDAWLAAVFHSCGVIIAGFVSLFYACSKYNLKNFRYHYESTLALVKRSFPILVTALSGNLNNSSVPIVIGIFSSAYSAGIYNVAQVFRNISNQLILAIFQSLYPRSIKLFQEDKILMRNFLRLYLKITLALGLLGVCLVIWFAPLAVEILAGREFLEAVDVLRILIFAVFFVIINNFLGMQTLIPFGHNNEYGASVFLASIIGFLTMVPLTQFFGAIGSAFSVVLTEFIVMLSLLRLHKKHSIDIVIKSFKKN